MDQSVQPVAAPAAPKGRRYFRKARQSVTSAAYRPDEAVATLSPVAIGSTTRKGIGSTVARRRFQRGTVYLNKPKTQWIGAYSEYALDAHGVERRKRVRIVLSPVRKDDGTVRKNEAKNLLQPYINRVNEQSAFPLSLIHI